MATALAVPVLAATLETPAPLLAAAAGPLPLQLPADQAPMLTLELPLPPPTLLRRCCRSPEPIPAQGLAAGRSAKGTRFQTVLSKAAAAARATGVLAGPF